MVMGLGFSKVCRGLGGKGAWSPWPWFLAHVDHGHGFVGHEYIRVGKTRSFGVVSGVGAGFEVSYVMGIC